MKGLRWAICFVVCVALVQCFELCDQARRTQFKKIAAVLWLRLNAARRPLAIVIVAAALRELCKDTSLLESCCEHASARQN